jgi:hypothetical protein
MLESTGKAIDLSDSEMLGALYRAATADVLPPGARGLFRPGSMQVEVLQWVSLGSMAPVRLEVAVLPRGVRVIFTAPDGSRLWERLLLFAGETL